MEPEHTSWEARWQRLADRLTRRADRAGLGGVAEAATTALRPLSPVAVQLLWIAQPVSGVFGGADAIGALAELLDERPEQD